MNQYKFERPFENFEVLDLTHPTSKDRLRELLLADHHNSPSPAGYALLDMFLSSSMCRSVVVESNYFDRDHLRSYQRFYARSFAEYGRYSTRLHFFGESVTRASLSNLERPQIANSYLGFLVLRPLRVRKVGRTVLNPFTADPDADFPLGLSTYEVNLAGSKLSVRGAPFLEQDGNVGVCATAALWMSTTVAGRLLDVRPWTTAEITEHAFDFPLGEQVLAARGLAVREMEAALRNMGYKPLVLGIQNEEAALQVIHPYLEGGIPPILLLELEDGHHAVVAVGHGYDSAADPQIPAQVQWEGAPIQFWRSSQWINYLLVHDDQRGPYRRLTLRSPADAAAWAAANPKQEPNCLGAIDMSFPNDGHWAPVEPVRLYGALIPVPVGVTLTGLEAEEKAARLLHMFFAGIGTPMPSDFVLRTYLTRSNDFKRFASRRGLAKKPRDLWRGKPMPRWIWVTEICRRADVAAGANQRKIIGEVLLDGNASPFTPDFLSLHLVGGGGLGFLALMRPSDSDAAEALSRGVLYQGAASYSAFSAPPV